MSAEEVLAAILILGVGLWVGYWCTGPHGPYSVNARPDNGLIDSTHVLWGLEEWERRQRKKEGKRDGQ